MATGLGSGSSGLSLGTGLYKGVSSLWSGAAGLVTGWGAGATAPANTVLPAITGTTTVGQTLTCSTGTWAGTATITYAYQWKRAGVDIGGATASTYALVVADQGSTITCTVTATNSAGSASATSAATAAISPIINYDYTAGSLPGGNTFTRASSGTRINSSGVLVTETTDVARFNYNPVSPYASRGLLVEASRTNLFTYSNAMANAVWIALGATKTANTVGAPDGNTEGATITANASNSFHGVYRASTLTSGATYTRSHYVKKNSHRYVILTSNAGGAAGYICAVFDLDGGGSAATQTGTSGTASLAATTQTDVGGGWYRLTITGALAATSIIGTLALANAATGNTLDANGNNVWSAAGTEAIYAWGGQLEAGATASTLIPTTTASATRAADALSFTIPSGVATIRYTFDDDTTQDVAVSAGSYPVPTTLDRPNIKTIVSVA